MNANVGMLNPVAATVSTYVEGTSISYGTGKKIAEAVSASLSWERSNNNFYGDDEVLDSDNGINGYTLDFEPSGLTDEARAYILGETVQTGEYSVTDQSSPEVGFGYVRVMRSTNTAGKVVTAYEGWWFYRMKFGVSSEETRTKEGGIEWRIPTLNGTGMGVRLDSTGTAKYAVHKSFTTQADAVAYVNGKAGIT